LLLDTANPKLCGRSVSSEISSDYNKLPLVGGGLIPESRTLKNGQIVSECDVTCWGITDSLLRSLEEHSYFTGLANFDQF